MNPPLTVEYGLLSASGDEEEYFGGFRSNNTSDLDLGSDIVGLQFTGIDVPAGAIITDAYIQFTADETGSGAAELTILGRGQRQRPAVHG